jgi:hypothetical protein
VEEMRPSNCGSLLKNHKGMPKLEGNNFGFCHITLLLDPTFRYLKAQRIFFMYLEAPLIFVNYASPRRGDTVNLQEASYTYQEGLF